MKIRIENTDENMYQLIIEDLSISEITSLLHIFERATQTNKKAKIFLEKLKDVLDRNFLKN